MPAGMSKAKGRRNSKSKRRPGFEAHPRKAGPKRPPNLISYRDTRTGKRHWKTG